MNKTVIDWTAIPKHPELLAEHIGEHNARVTALKAQAERVGNAFDWIEAMFLTRRTDGFGQWTSEFPQSGEVAAIHSRLIADYLARNDVARFFAYDATAHDAFVEWDRASCDATSCELVVS